MKYPEFKLETYLAAREFVAPYNLCAYDLETHTMLADLTGIGVQDLQIAKLFIDTHGDAL